MTIFADLFDTALVKFSIAMHQTHANPETRHSEEQARNMLFTYDGKTADLMAVQFKWAYKQIFKKYANANNYIEFIVDLYGHREGWTKKHVELVIDYIYYKNLEHHFKAIKGGAFAPAAHVDGDVVTAREEFDVVKIISDVLERGI